MKCHESGSTSHLVARCPKRRMKGKGKGTYYASPAQASGISVSQTNSSMAYAAASNAAASKAATQVKPASGIWQGMTVRGYFTEEVSKPRMKSWHTQPSMASSVTIEEIMEEDWTQIRIEGTVLGDKPENKPTSGALSSTEYHYFNDLPMSEATNRLWNYPWWKLDMSDTQESQEFFLVKTRMKNHRGEGLLVDPWKSKQPMWRRVGSKASSTGKSCRIHRGVCQHARTSRSRRHWSWQSKSNRRSTFANCTGQRQIVVIFGTHASQ